MADGLSPFYILGIVDLSIQFADKITKIQAHIANNLCTDIILGMDYIILYNLKIDRKHQLISIELNDRQYYIQTNYNYLPHLIPTTLSKSLHLLPDTNCLTKVSIPVSSISSPFTPNTHFTRNNTLHVPNKLLHFHNYPLTLTLSNKSPYPQYIRKGICIGFVSSYLVQQQNHHTSNFTFGLSDPIKTFGETPDFTSLNKDISNDYNPNNSISRSTITPINPMVEENFHELAQINFCWSITILIL